MGRVNTSYESEHTKFIREQMKQHPEWEEDQRAGRAIWWDKPQTPDETKRSAESSVKARPYPYDVNF